MDKYGLVSNYTINQFKVYKSTCNEEEIANEVERNELKFQLADYVHWFNNFRIHGSLGYLSPVDFKKLHLAK